MTEDQPWFAPRDRAAPFALGEEPRSWGEFLADAHRLAGWIATLPQAGAATHRREFMVACVDRYRCAVSLLAIWSSGGVAALPPHGRPESVDALCGERNIAWVLHDGGGEGGLDVRTVLDGAEARPSGGQGQGQSDHPPPPALSFPGEQPLVCLYTSGSTGAHVACLKTAAQLLGEARLLAKLFELGPGSRMLATVPPHHIYGLLFGVLVPMVGGGAVVRSTPHHGETIAGEARRWRADLLCSVPAHLRGLTVLPQESFPALRRIFSSGAALGGETAMEVSRRHGKPVVEILGSSETGGIAWRERAPARPAGADANEPASEPWWRPFPNISVDVDADGVMLLRSPFVVPANPGGTYRGADRIALVADGCFALLGRADGIVKIAGSRVSIAEVERLLGEVPGVRDAAVISVAVATTRQHELWAAVVADANLSVPALRSALLRRLDPIAVPRRFRMVDALPREDNGKLVRARVQALFTAGDIGTGAAAGGPAPGQPGHEDAGDEDAGDEGHQDEGRQDEGRQDDRLRIDLKVSPESSVYRFFEGHFRTFPILAGVVQLNNLVLHAVRERWPALRRLERVLSLKFRSPIRPEERLVIQLERMKPERVAFEIRRADQVVSSGVLVFALPGSASAKGGVA